MYAPVGPLADHFRVSVGVLVAALVGLDNSHGVVQRLASACRGHLAWINGERVDSEIEVLEYDGEKLDGDGDPLNPETLVTVMPFSVEAKGNLELTADSVIGIEYLPISEPEQG